MTLAELPDDAMVFVDANIFVYHFTGVSAQCKALLDRAERDDYSIFFWKSCTS